MCFFDVRDISRIRIIKTSILFFAFLVIDRVSCNSNLVKDIQAARLAVAVLLVTMCGDDGCKAALYHCEIARQRRTFLTGTWCELGLGKSSSLYDIIDQCNSKMAQMIFS